MNPQTSLPTAATTTRVDVMAGPTLVVLNYDLRIHFNKKPSENFEKQDLLLADPGGYIARPRTYREDRRRKGGSMNLGFCVH